MYTMDPYCASRKDRFRLEPAAAQWGDPDRYVRSVLAPLSEVPGLALYTFNFPCSFAMEEIDDTCRVMLYGHGKRGTDSPIWVFQSGSAQHEYFVSQIRWLEALCKSPDDYWSAKGVVVRRWRQPG